MERFTAAFAQLPSPVRHFLAALVGTTFTALGYVVVQHGGVAGIDWGTALLDAFGAGLVAAFATVGVLAGTPAGQSYGVGVKPPAVPIPVTTPEQVKTRKPRKGATPAPAKPIPAPAPAKPKATKPKPKPAKPAKQVKPKGKVRKAAKRKGNTSAPYAHTTWNGLTVDNRTASALREVQRRVGHPVTITQGSPNTSVNASGQTHAGGGAVDVNVNGLSRRQIKKLVRAMRAVGFAAWYRPTIPGLWGHHIHAILLGHRTASAAAKSQMVAYRNHRDGLVSNNWDSTWRPKGNRRWNHRKNQVVITAG